MERIVNVMEKADTERKDRKPRNTDTAHVRNMLLMTAEKCGKLATAIRDEGRALNNEEKQLVRFAIYPALDESMNEMKSAFLTGDARWLERALDGFGDYAVSFMD